MTIGEYLTTGGGTLSPCLASNLLSVDIWSNAACLGYATLGMEAAGIDPAHIQAARAAMIRAFDTVPTDEAEKLSR